MLDIALEEHAQTKQSLPSAELLASELAAELDLPVIPVAMRSRGHGQGSGAGFAASRQHCPGGARAVVPVARHVQPPQHSATVLRGGASQLGGGDGAPQRRRARTDVVVGVVVGVCPLSLGAAAAAATGTTAATAGEKRQCQGNGSGRRSARQKGGQEFRISLLIVACVEAFPVLQLPLLLLPPLLLLLLLLYV